MSERTNVVIGCAQCSGGMAGQWKITVAGVVDQNCSGCSGFNGEYLVDYVSGCIFQKNYIVIRPTHDPFNGCQTHSIVRVKMFFVGGSSHVWQVQFFGNDETFDTIATYSIAESSWDCQGSNTLNRQGFNFACTWPLTITAEPVT